MEKLKHFIRILSIDMLSVLSMAIAVFSSVYIKEFDLYIPQRIFIIIAIAVPLLYNIVSSILYNNNSENQIADAIIPIGIVFSLILAQYFVFSLLIIYLLIAIALLYGLIKHKLSTAKYAIMLILAVTILSSIIATTYLDKAFLPQETSEQEKSIIVLTEEEWQEKSVDEKLNYLKTIADYECDKLGCKKTKIAGKALQEKQSAYQGAYYNKKTDAIIISIYELKQASYIDSVITVIHEVRHRYQKEVVSFIEENSINIKDTNLKLFKEINNWADSMSHYSDYSEGEKDYFDQAIEKDAREYSEIEAERILRHKEIYQAKE